MHAFVQAARIGGAVLLAPVLDKVLEFVDCTFRLKSRRSAFMLIVSSCIGIALAVFGGTVLMHV